MKYPIKKEFFPYSCLKLAVQVTPLARKLGALLKPPRSLFRDKDLTCERIRIESFDSNEIELITLSPRTDEILPCLVYYHGGGVAPL